MKIKNISPLSLGHKILKRDCNCPIKARPSLEICDKFKQMKIINGRDT
jgi:hypothetical protein